MQETFRVGDRFSDLAMLDSFPVGTVINQGNRSRWTKHTDGFWHHRSGGAWTVNDFGLRTLTITEFPGGIQEISVPAATVERVKWRFRTGALAAASQHGVGVRTVETALKEMGCGKDEATLPLGRGVRIPADARNDLPAGSVIYCGNPENYTQLAVFAKKGREWVHVLGERTFFDGEVIIESIGGNRERPEWLDREGTEEDARAIAEFKATAWRVGYDLKRTNGWCGTYDEIVNRLGVSREDTRRAAGQGFREGQRVTAEQTASLPAGTIMFWRHSQNPSTWAVYVRDDRSSNQARTRLVCGTSDSHENYKRYMTVASIADASGNAGWLLPEEPPNVWDALPPGTVFGVFQNEEEYVLCGNRTLDPASTRTRRVPPSGQYQRDNFGSNPQWRVRRFIG